MTNLKGKTVFYPSTSIIIVDSSFTPLEKCVSVKIDSISVINDVVSVNKNTVLLPLNFNQLFNVGDTLSIIGGDELITDPTIILCLPGEEYGVQSQDLDRVCISALSGFTNSIVNILGHVEHIEKNSPLNGKDRFGIRISDGKYSFV